MAINTTSNDPKAIIEDESMENSRNSSKNDELKQDKNQVKEEILIKIESLNLWFGENHVLKNIDANFKKNNVTAVIGPSGCGKSTLLRSINLMNKLFDYCRMEGNIYYDGLNLLGNHLGGRLFDIRKNIGMVFQKPNPFPKSIFNNISYGPKVHKMHYNRNLTEIVEHTLKDAALWDEVKDRLNDSAFTLSGGQQQRLCIARALSVEPKVILMDEPCSALDPIATNKIEELITRLKEDYTVIIVTHNMQQAARVSDYTAFMYLGELIEFGETKQIFENPREELTENYITGRFG